MVRTRARRQAVRQSDKTRLHYTALLHADPWDRAGQDRAGQGRGGLLLAVAAASLDGMMCSKTRSLDRSANRHHIRSAPCSIHVM